jgi:thiamine biosynthesis protein ThiI
VSDAPKTTLVVHYAEIGTKGKNRALFERRLMAHLGLALRDVGIDAGVRRVPGRLTIDLPGGASAEAAPVAVDRLTKVPGVSSVSVGVAVPTDVDAISKAAIAFLEAAPPGSFKIDTRRGFKEFALDSIAVSRAVGAACVAATGRPVDVHHPVVTVRVEIPSRTSYVIGPGKPGPGGLPPGSTGTLLALLSGGIDSPVAAWKMMRRGARVVAVHFWNRTREGNAVLEKLEDLCRVLALAQGEVPLVVVPFEACQRAIVAVVPGEFRMIVYRRAMLRIASKIALRERALGYVTGDSLGQVASQTASNLRSIHAVADLPVYSPLMGDDKVEVVNQAKRIGTYEVSIRPHDDCCSFLIADHPATKSSPSQVARLEEGLDWEALVAEALAGVSRSEVRSRASGSPVVGSAHVP